MLRALLAIFFVFNISAIHAQLDTAFYLAPIPEWSNQTQEIEISTPFPKSPIFTPVKTISFIPFDPIFLAFSIILLNSSLLETPLAFGIVQYVHL